MPSALVSDDDDVGNGDTGMQGEHLPPEFDPQSSFFGSTYVKPERGQLISYIWANQPQLLYRVGLLVSDPACGRLRFYEGYKEPTLERATSRYNPQDIRFHLTKAAFQQGSFRIRNDLQIGACCYDWAEKRSYRLRNISFETGAVQVESLDGTTQCWISPDDLVGGCVVSTGQGRQKRKRLHTPLIESNKSDSHNERLQHFGSNTNSPESQQGDGPDKSTGSSIPRSLTLSSGILTYEHIIGILECSEPMNAEGWYARGRLRVERREDGSLGEAKLVEGECVHYCRTTRRCVKRELLQWSPRQIKFLQVTSRRDKERIWSFAWQAEIEHAAKVRTRPGRTGLSWRPLQPVYIQSKGPGILVEAPDRSGFCKVVHPLSELADQRSLMKINLERSVETMTAVGNIRLIGHEKQLIDMEDFFRREGISMAPQKASYRAEPDHLLNPGGPPT